MGQKTHPTAMRLGFIKDWNSKWFAEKAAFREYLQKDIEVRQSLMNYPKLKDASVSRIEIQRAANTVNIRVHTARPGMVIGKKGEDIERLRHYLSHMIGSPVHLSVEEIRKPELDATLVAQGVARQLEKRIMFRRAMKRAVSNTMRVGAQGIRLQVAGRLNGAEIARTEWYREGRVPLHTLRANIDYGLAEAHTTYGVIGVKCWIFLGEVFSEQKTEAGLSKVEQA